MEKGDIFIDGGNSNYKDSQRRREGGSGEGIRFHRLRHFWRRVGIERGLQHDGRRLHADVNYVRPIFETLAPARTRGGDTWGRRAQGIT